jgi:hypothetical protein
MAAVIRHWPERWLFVWLDKQPVNEKLVDILWDLEAVVFLLRQPYRLEGSC